MSSRWRWCRCVSSCWCCCRSVSCRGCGSWRCSGRVSSRWRCSRRRRRRWCWTRLRAVSPAGVQVNCGSAVKGTTPDDHFTASPHCRLLRSRSRCVGGAGLCPGVRPGIVSSASVEVMVPLVVKVATPDDHFTASPHRGMSVAASGRVVGAGSGPTVVVRIVSAAGI